eukprot:COSAG04_NODE_2361_length_4270_cov_178.644929_2_plen_109_part_00
MPSSSSSLSKAIPNSAWASSRCFFFFFFFFFFFPEPSAGCSGCSGSSSSEESAIGLSPASSTSCFFFLRERRDLPFFFSDAAFSPVTLSSSSPKSPNSYDMLARLYSG